MKNIAWGKYMFIVSHLVVNWQLVSPVV